MDSREDLEDVIWSLMPEGSPIFGPEFGRRRLAKSKGGSMRKRRRRLMKPLQFTSVKMLCKAVYEWRQDPLIHVWSG